MLIALLSLSVGLALASLSQEVASLLLFQVLQPNSKGVVLLPVDPLFSFVLPIKFFATGAGLVACPTVLAWSLGYRLPKFAFVAIALFLLCTSISGLAFVAYREYMQVQISASVSGQQITRFRGQLTSMSEVPLVSLSLVGPVVVALMVFALASRRAKARQ